MEPGINKGPWLFNMQIDENESYDVAEHYADQAATLKLTLDTKRQEIKDNPKGWLTIK